MSRHSRSKSNRRQSCTRPGIAKRPTSPPAWAASSCGTFCSRAPWSGRSRATRTRLPQPTCPSSGASAKVYQKMGKWQLPFPRFPCPSALAPRVLERELTYVLIIKVSPAIPTPTLMHDDDVRLLDPGEQPTFGKPRVGLPSQFRHASCTVSTRIALEPRTVGAKDRPHEPSPSGCFSVNRPQRSSFEGGAGGSRASRPPRRGAPARCGRSLPARAASLDRSRTGPPRYRSCASIVGDGARHAEEGLQAPRSFFISVASRTTARLTDMRAASALGLAEGARQLGIAAPHLHLGDDRFLILPLVSLASARSSSSCIFLRHPMLTDERPSA